MRLKSEFWAKAYIRRCTIEGAAAELVALELNEATLALGTITGETTPEDVLERIFERFCVGK